MNTIIERVWNRNSMVNIEDLRGVICQAEEEGHTFRIRGVDASGTAVALSGTPAGVCLRPDNTDVALDCEVSDGCVLATLPAECYDVQGRFGITVYLTSDDQKTAIYAAIGSVARASSGNASPGTTASVVDLINAIEAAISEIPASDTNLKGALAPTYSTSAVYAVGSYAWYDGKLYKCISAITSGETWTAAHWTEAKLASDVSDLKSALNIFSCQNVLDNISYSNTVRGITVKKNGVLYDVNGDLLSGQTSANFELYQDVFPQWLIAGKIYNVFFQRTNTALSLKIYGYNESNNASLLYDSATALSNDVWFDPDYSTRILIRFRVDGAGASFAEVVKFAIMEPLSNNAICDSIQKSKNEIDYVIKNEVDLSQRNSGSDKGVAYNINPFAGTVTMNGIASANLLYKICEITNVDEVIIHGCADGGASSTYNIAVYQEGNRKGYVTDSTSYVTVSVDSTKTSYVYIVVFQNTVVSNLVFRPVVYSNGKIIDALNSIDALTAKVEKVKSVYIPYAGNLFIAHCGDSVFVDEYAFRCYNRESASYTTARYTTHKLPLDSETARYVDFDGTDYTITRAPSKYSIAEIHDHYVIPFLSNIIANYRRIQNGYLRSDSEYTINFLRTPIEGILAYAYPDIKISERGYILKSTGPKNYVVNNSTCQFTLEQNSVDISNKKILMIGDSFVARGFIQQHLLQKVGTLQFIGTKTTQNYNIKSEGVSGSRLYYFIDPETSPFYFNNALDFSEYLTTNNLSAPDYVVINSAINHGKYIDSTWGSYESQVETLVNMIRAYSTDIKIYVTFGANYAMNPGSDYGYPNIRYSEVRKCGNSIYDIDNIVVIPVDYTLIDNLDYTWTTYDYFGNNVQILSDCVHPTEDQGFQKIADMIYNYLGI